MALIKPPFRSYTLDEDRPDPLEQGKVFTVRVNAKEYAELKDAMKFFNLRNESTTLKALAKVGLKVIHTLFGAKFMRWITSPSRVKADE